jgi:hypothetical protein
MTIGSSMEEHTEKTFAITVDGPRVTSSISWSMLRSYMLANGWVERTESAHDLGAVISKEDTDVLDDASRASSDHVDAVICHIAIDEDRAKYQVLDSIVAHANAESDLSDGNRATFGMVDNLIAGRLTNEFGALNKQAVRDELFDYLILRREALRAYTGVTDGQVRTSLAFAEHVVDIVNQRVRDAYEQGRLDERMSAVPANEVVNEEGLLSAESALGVLSTYANCLRSEVRGNMVRGVRSVVEAVAVLNVLDAIADRDPSFQSNSESNASRVSEIMRAIRANDEVGFVSNDIGWTPPDVPATEDASDVDGAS